VPHIPWRALVVLLSAAILAGSLCPGAWAQGRGAVVIDSSPRGAIVELVGEHVFRGVTPWRLDRGLSGTYTVRAYRVGYEDWEGHALLSASRRDSIFIRMSRKTELAVGLRSAILPGWGQFHTGQNVKAGVFFLAEVSAATCVLWADSKRRDAARDYNEARLEYLAADQVDEIEDAYIELRKAYDEFHRWHENRKRWSYAAAAIWLANILDAVLLLPAPGEGSYSGLPPGDESGLFASIEPDKTTAGLVVRF
jgi:hypothetical protein